MSSVFLFVFTVLDLAAVTYAISHEDTTVYLEQWEMQALAVVTVLILLLTCIGNHFTRRLKNDNPFDDDERTLQVIVIGKVFFLLVLIAMSIVLFLIYATLREDGMSAHPTSDMTSLDNRAQTFLQAHPALWINMQNSYNCCGYLAYNDDLATGDECGVQLLIPPLQPNSVCKPFLVNAGRRHLLYMSSFTLALAVVLFIDSLVTSCIVCQEPPPYAHAKEVEGVPASMDA